MTFKSANIIFHNSCPLGSSCRPEDTPRMIRTVGPETPVYGVSRTAVLFYKKVTEFLNTALAINGKKRRICSGVCRQSILCSGGKPDNFCAFAFLAFFQIFFYILTGIRFFYFRDFLGCSFRDYRASSVAAFRSHVDNIIRRLNHI